MGPFPVLLPGAAARPKPRPRGRIRREDEAAADATAPTGELIVLSFCEFSLEPFPDGAWQPRRHYCGAARPAAAAAALLEALHHAPRRACRHLFAIEQCL